MNEISPKLRNSSGGFMVMPRHVVHSIDSLSGCVIALKSDFELLFNFIDLLFRVQKFDYLSIGTSEEVKKA